MSFSSMEIAKQDKLQTSEANGNGAKYLVSRVQMPQGCAATEQLKICVAQLCKEIDAMPHATCHLPLATQTNSQAVKQSGSQPSSKSFAAKKTKANYHIIESGKKQKEQEKETRSSQVTDGFVCLPVPRILRGWGREADVTR